MVDIDTAAMLCGWFAYSTRSIISNLFSMISSHRSLHAIVLVVVASLALLSCSSSHQIGTAQRLLPGVDSVAGENVLSLVPTGDGDVVAVTASQIILLDNQGRQRSSVKVAGVTSILLWGDRLIAGSAHGLQSIDMNRREVRSMPLPAINEYPPIGGIAVDHEGVLWVGTLGEGLYRCDATEFIPQQGAPTITSLAATSDGSLWIGTNIGLHRIRHGGYVAYSEEIHHEGITIPDNIVDRLSVDRWGNLWVFMSKAISVFTPDQMTGRADHVDPETYAFIGSASNEIHAMASGPEKTRWFASDEGILMLRGIDVDDVEGGEEHGFGDVITPPQGELLRLSDSLLSKQRCNDLLFDGTENLWIATSSGVWRIDADALASKMISVRRREARK